MSNRSNKEVAYAARVKIRDYWQVNGKQFHAPHVGVDKYTFAISSDMKDGYPPRVKTRTR